MNNVHFAIPEIYGETLSYYELLRKLVDKTNELIDNYNNINKTYARIRGYECYKKYIERYEQLKKEVNVWVIN